MISFERIWGEEWIKLIEKGLKIVDGHWAKVFNELSISYRAHLKERKKCYNVHNNRTRGLYCYTVLGL